MTTRVGSRVGSGVVCASLVWVALCGARSADAVPRSMTGSLAVLNPSSPSFYIDSGPAVAGDPVGPFAPTTGAQTVEAAGSATGTFVGRTITVGPDKLNMQGGFLALFPAYPNVGGAVRSFMSDQYTMTFRNGGGALGGCPGPGCTAGGQGTKIDWCPPKKQYATRPAPGAPGHEIGNWDCTDRLAAGFKNREARIRISNAPGAPHFGGTLNLLRRQRTHAWRVLAQPSTPAASDALASRDWKKLSAPAAAGGPNFNFVTQEHHLGPTVRARIDPTRGAVVQTFGCANGIGTVGVGKTFTGLPSPSGPFIPLTGLGSNCGTRATINTGPDFFWGFRMTTGTISGSAFFPFQRNTTALGTPFAPVIQPMNFGQGFFFSRMGHDSVDGTARNVSLVGGGIAYDNYSGFDFFQVADLRMKLTVPEPTGHAALVVGIAMLAASADRRRSRAERQATDCPPSTRRV